MPGAVPQRSTPPAPFLSATTDLKHFGMAQAHAALLHLKGRWLPRSQSKRGSAHPVGSRTASSDIPRAGASTTRSAGSWSCGRQVGTLAGARSTWLGETRGGPGEGKEHPRADGRALRPHSLEHRERRVSSAAHGRMNMTLTPALATAPRPARPRPGTGAPARGETWYSTPSSGSPHEAAPRCGRARARFTGLANSSPVARRPWFTVAWAPRTGLWR